MECLLEELRRFDALRDGDAGNDVVAERALDAISPTYADKKVLDRLPSTLTDALILSELGDLRQCWGTRTQSHRIVVRRN